MLKYRNSVLHEGENLIQQIDAIRLSAFVPSMDVKPFDPEKIQRYIKGDLPIINFKDLHNYKSSELSEEEKRNTADSIKKYWDITVSNDFFFVGNLTESTLFTAIAGRTDYNGTKSEKHKNTLIYELNWKIMILEYIDYTIDILRNVHLLPLCITNVSGIPERNITISFCTHNEGFRLFFLNSEITDESRELLDALAETLIEEKIIETVLSIKSTTNIDVEPEKWTPTAPFIMPNLFGHRNRYDIDDLVTEWEKYQAEESTDGIISYEISSLRSGETKWLSPYMIIVPSAGTFSLEYTILAEASGEKKSGTINIDNKLFTKE